MSIQLLNEDCMAVMGRYPDKYFDLAIVDPPYGINAPNMQMGQNLNRADGWKREASTAVKVKGRLNTGSGKLKNRLLKTSKIGWDNEKPSQQYFEELFRVSKNQIIWGGNYFNLQPSRGVICWDKVQPWENFSQWEMAWTSFDCPAKMFRFSNTGGANAETKIHPTQKPTALYQWILSQFAKPDMRILDTHLGSGSSAIAAHRFGVAEFIGTEIDADYYEAAKHRFHLETDAAYKVVHKLKTTGQTDLFLSQAS